MIGAVVGGVLAVIAAGVAEWVYEQNRLQEAAELEATRDQRRATAQQLEAEAMRHLADPARREAFERVYVALWIEERRTAAKLARCVREELAHFLEEYGEGAARRPTLAASATSAARMESNAGQLELGARRTPTVASPARLPGDQWGVA